LLLWSRRLLLLLIATDLVWLTFNELAGALQAFFLIFVQGSRFLIVFFVTDIRIFFLVLKRLLAFAPTKHLDLVVLRGNKAALLGRGGLRSACSWGLSVSLT
jgi:hypothetical protein